MMNDNRRNNVQIFLITSTHGTSITQKRPPIPQLGYRLQARSQSVFGLRPVCRVSKQETFASCLRGIRN